MKYIDIGVNLLNRQYRHDVRDVINTALEDEVGLIITGTDNYTNKNACGLIDSLKCSGVWSTCGFHPHNADSWCDLYRQSMIDLLDTKECIKAIGEIGLDYDRMYSSKESQMKCFENILEIAEGYHKPLFLHEREAVNDFIKILSRHESLCNRAVVHCFTGTEETAREYLDLGCYIGLTGWICDNKRNQDVIKALDIIPMEKLMVETDAPYLTPKGYGLSSRNIPNNVIYVVKKIAEVKGLPVEKVRETVYKNTLSFFSI